MSFDHRQRILRYLKYSPNIGLWYPKGAHFDLVGFSDSDYAGCKVDRKITSGGCQFLRRSLVFWSSKNADGPSWWFMNRGRSAFRSAEGPPVSDFSDVY